MPLSVQPTLLALRSARHRIFSFKPEFKGEPALLQRLTIQQAERLRNYLPQLGLMVCLSTIVAAVALRGDLPWIVQFGPPGIILLACVVLLLRWKRSAPITLLKEAEATLREAPRLAGALGCVAGFWCVSAFNETEQYYCLVAPVFLAIAMMLAANCLDSVPRAATALIATASLPIVVLLASYNNLTLRAVAMMVVVCGFMQLRLIYAKYAETIRTLELQNSIERLARTDPLTGLGNRRSFDEVLQELLVERQAGVTLLALDLDGFKHANDTFGHQAGDAILIAVAQRLRTLCPGAELIARIGGDEFALLMSPSLDDEALLPMLDSIRAVLSLPVAFGDNVVSVSASIGHASARAGEISPEQLVRGADRMLYNDKSSHKVSRVAALEAA